MLLNRWRLLSEASAEYDSSMLEAVTLGGSTARGQTTLLRRDNRRTGPVRQVRPLATRNDIAHPHTVLHA